MTIYLTLNLFCF